MQRNCYINQKLNKSFCYIVSDCQKVELFPSKLDYFGEMNESILSLKIHQKYKNTSRITDNQNCKAFLSLPQALSQSVTGITCILNGKKVDLNVEEQNRAKEISNLAEMSGRMTIRSEYSKDEQILNIILGLLPFNSECDITIQMEIASTNIESNIFQTLIPFSDQEINSNDFTFSIQFNESTKIECVQIFDNLNVKNKDYTFDGKILKLTNKPMDSIVLSTELKSQIPNIIINDVQDEYSLIQVFPKFSSKSINSDFIFILDCSGSMSGSSIKNAKECLSIFMHSLPVGCKFNIIKFGSTYQCVFDENNLVEYNDKNLETADNEIRKTEANFGGTNLYEPLLCAFKQSQNSREKGRVAQIFLLTDGEINDKEIVFKLVRKNRSKNRIFSLGIGYNVDKSLVCNVATLSYGNFDFINSSEITDKVVNLLSSALAPVLTDVNIHSSNEDLLEIVPSPMIPLYDGKMAMIYFKRKEKTKSIENVLITGNIASEQIEIVIDNHVNISNSSAKKLFAQKAIDDYQSIYEDSQLDPAELEKIKNKIIEISIENKILSKFTSFVGFEKNPHLDLNQQTQSNQQQKNGSLFDPFSVNTQRSNDYDDLIGGYDNSQNNVSHFDPFSGAQNYGYQYNPFDSSSNHQEHHFYSTLGQLLNRQFQQQQQQQNNVYSFSSDPFSSQNLNGQFQQQQQQQQQHNVYGFSSDPFSSQNLNGQFQQQQQQHNVYSFSSDPFSAQPNCFSNKCSSYQNDFNPFSAPPNQNAMQNSTNNSINLFSNNNSQSNCDPFSSLSKINLDDYFDGNNSNHTNNGDPLNGISIFGSNPEKETINKSNPIINSLIDIISSQNCDGKWSFTLFDSLLNFLFNDKTKMNDSQLNKFFESFKNCDKETIGDMKSTIVALLILMKIYEKEHSKWKLVEIKAINWLNSKLKMKWETEIPSLLTKM